MPLRTEIAQVPQVPQPDVNEENEAPNDQQNAELSKQMEDLKKRSADFSNVVSKLKEKNLPKAGKLQQKIETFRGNLDRDLVRHLENFDPASTPLSVEQYLTAFYESRLEQIIQEAVQEEMEKTGKRAVTNVVVLAKSITSAIKDKPEEQRENILKEAVEKATTEGPNDEAEIDRAMTLVKADKELGENETTLIRGTITEIASTDPILAGYLRTLGINELTIPRKDLLVALLSRLNEVDREKAEKIISALELTEEEKSSVMFELEQEDDTAEETSPGGQEQATLVEEEESDDQDERIEKLLEAIGVPNPLTSESKKIRDYLERRRTQIVEAAESFDYVSVKARQEELTRYITSIIYATPAGEFLDPAQVDRAFELYNLNAPEDANEAILRNLQDSRYVRESFLELIKERNKKALPVKIAEYSGIYKAVQKINEARGEGEKVTFENQLETENPEKDPIELADGMRSQYAEFVDQLTEEELNIVFEERNAAIIDYLLEVVSEGESPEFSQTLRSLLTDQDGVFDPTKVTLTNVSGNNCLVFSSEAVLAYIAKLNGVEVVSGEDGTQEARFTDEYLGSLSEEQLSRNALMVEGLAHKKENLIMTFDSGTSNLTTRHEAGHKQASDAIEIRKQLQNKMIAFKMVDAFLKHTQPELYVRLQNSNMDQVTQETRTLSKIVAAALEKGGTSELVTALGNKELATLLGLDTSELTPELEHQALQILEAIEYSFQNNDRKEDEDFILNLQNETHELSTSQNFSEVPEQQLMYLLGKLKDLRIYQEKKNKTLDDMDYVANTDRVTELYTQMQDHFSSKELLTLSSLGYTPSEFNVRYEDPDQDEELSVRAEFNENAIESLTMIRLLNQLMTDNDDLPEGLLDIWKNRIMQYEQFNTSNTLKFIFDLVSADEAYGLNFPDGDNSREELESVLGDLDDDGEVFSYYDDFAQKELKTGEFRAYAIKALKQRAIQFDWSESELQEKLDNIDSTLDRVMGIYASVLAKGFEPTDEEIGEGRIVSTDKYDLSEPVDIRSHVSLLDKSGYVHYYFSQAESPFGGGIPIVGDLISTALSNSGLAPKDLAEIGAVRDVRQINRNKLLPFGIGETEWGARIAERLGLHRESAEDWRSRLGADTLTRLEMKSIYDVMWQQTIEAMVKEAQIQQYHAMLLASERIGVLYFDGELNQPGVYSALEEVDKYYDANIYQQGQPGGALYNKMIANGYSEEEIKFMVEAFNPIQQMGGVPVDRAKMKFRLGTVTDHWIKRAKMMRMKDVYTKILNKGSAEDFIRQGQTFDDIGSAIMRLQQEAEANGQVFTLRNVIDDIIEVEGEKPGGKLGEWKEKRKTVNIGGTNFALEDVKDFVQSFIHARTYEATATGVFGQKEVVKIGEGYYEVVPGFTPMEDEQKRQFIKRIKDKSLGLDPETQAKREYTIRLIDQQIEPLQKLLREAQLAYDKELDDTKKVDLGNILLQRQADIQNLENQRKAQINFNQSPEEVAKEFAGFFNLIRVQDPDSIPQTVKDILAADPDIASHIYRDFNAQISMKSPQGYGTKTLKPFQGLTKQKHNDMFGKFVQHSDEGGENNYSLTDYSGKMMNAVEDVVVERTKVLELYFAHQLLLRQAENYKKKASMLKEKWVGIARFDQILRWITTAGFLASLVISVSSLSIPGIGIITGAFLNPGVIALLLADYFFISNRLTRIATMWGDRKKNAIKAEEGLFNQETQFEQALSNPAFSSTRGRLRLAQSVKSGEDVLKSALLAKKDVDQPDNRIQNSLTGAYEWAKDVVT